MNPWPTEVFGFSVIKEPIGDQGAQNLKPPINLMLHTGEAPTDEIIDGTFHSAPLNASHFAVDEDSIYQFRSLDHWAGSLYHDPNAPESPNLHAVQIEIADFSKTTPWRPKAGTMARVCALVAYASQYHSIPLVVPNPKWKDDCSDMGMPWAVTTNSRRLWAAQQGRWPNVRGVWEHLEVPLNNHWDCGAMDRSGVIAGAQALLKGDDVPLTDKDKDELGINFAIGQQRHAEGLPRTAINPKNVKALEGWDSAEAVRVAIAKGGALPPGTKLTVTVD